MSANHISGAPDNPPAIPAVAFELIGSGDSRLAAVVESSDDAIITKTLDGIIVTWNQGAERVFGYTAAEVIGKPVTILMSPEHVNEEPPILARIRRGERVDHYQTVRQHKNGSRIDISLTISPIKDAKGQIIGASKIARDITQQKRTEAALRAVDQRFRIMADFSPTLIWMSDHTKGFTWFNKPWLEFTGRAMSDELGFGWTEDLHPDDVTAFLKIYLESYEARQPFRVECRMRHRDGGWRWMVNSAVPLFEEQGDKFSGFVGSCLDITEMRRASSERESVLEAERAARNEAERLGHMKDEFLATLSHELRTPLNAVLGWTVLLRRLPPNSDQHSKGLETIERNARAQAKIIEDLLDMSRIISGKVQLEPSPVDVADVVKASVEAIRPTADTKRIQLSTDYGAGVSLIQGDANRLQQILWNLLTNAAKFTPTGGRIEVAVVRVDAQVEIHVKDSGIGIEPDFLAHAFDRFRQADASITRGHGGLGLGLAIVKNLVELHGGSVRVSSDGEGKGSTFIVSLPLAGVYDHGCREADPAEGPIDLPSLDLPSLANVTILVVDDQPDARELIAGLIVDRRGHVLTAGSAEEALEILAHHQVDVLVSDIGMPSIDGYELIRRVRAQATAVSRIPSIALTAYARADDRKRALQAGFQMHLTKPVELRDLIVGIAGLAQPQG